MRRVLDILYNFHWVVSGGAARSAQPYLGAFDRFLETNGIRAVVNLRGRHPGWGWWLHEERVCRRAGIVHFDAPLNSRLLPTRAMLVALMDAYDAAPQPILIKCSGGQDRTSFASALFIVHRGGWGAVEQAKAQFARYPYLHFPKRQQLWLRRFLDHAREEAAGAPLSDWIRSGYDPQRLADWLRRHGEGDTFKGLYPP